MQIKAIIFDFFGVICSEIGSNWLKSHVQAESMPAVESEYNMPSNLGEISEEKFFDGVAKFVSESGADREILRKYDLEELFELIVVSSEVDMMKPDPKIFLYTLQQLGISPEEAIFIDDREVNTKAAESLAIRSIIYKDTDLFLKEFVQIVA